MISPSKPMTSPTRCSSPTSTSSSIPIWRDPRARTTGPLIHVIVPTRSLMVSLHLTLYTQQRAGFPPNARGESPTCCRNAIFHLLHPPQLPFPPQEGQHWRIVHSVP